MPWSVTAGTIDQIGISKASYVVDHNKYVTAHQIINIPSVLLIDSGTANNANKIKALTIDPDKIQGLNLPHLVLTFATMIPVNGSLTASKILAAISTAPTKAAFKPK